MINYNPKLGLFPQIFLNYSESCENPLIFDSVGSAIFSKFLDRELYRN
jgi:hypothetical protein